MPEAVKDRANEPLGAENGVVEWQIGRDQRAASFVALAEAEPDFSVV